MAVIQHGPTDTTVTGMRLPASLKDCVCFIFDPSIAVNIVFVVIPRLLRGIPLGFLTIVRNDYLFSQKNRPR